MIFRVLDLKNLKISNRDKGLCFYFVMNHRQAFRDKYMPVATGRYFKLRYYQIPPALTDNITVFGGRSIGKSLELEISIIQTMIL